ncbi:hypothetical protein CapIbe_017832 [Capra ibex]
MLLFAYLNSALRLEATETRLTRGGRTAEESQGGGGEEGDNGRLLLSESHSLQRCGAGTMRSEPDESRQHVEATREEAQRVRRPGAWAWRL